MKNKKLKKGIIITAVSVFTLLFLLMPLSAVIIYESVFGFRYEAQQQFTIEDFDNLVVETADFKSEENTLAGYYYSKADSEYTGSIVVFVHGLGCGGHDPYLSVIDALCERGYTVFTYDATGNGLSEGDSVEGLPRGIVDLNNAVNFVKADPSRRGDDIFLIGHSWGAYCAGCVLELQPDIKAAVLACGFNSSKDMLLCKARGYVGYFADLTLPYVTFYERLKFGDELSEMTVTDSLSSTDAEIMIIHSRDDMTVPIQYGYEKYYNEFKDDQRFEFVLFEERGHAEVFYEEEKESSVSATRPDEELIEDIAELLEEAAE